MGMRLGFAEGVAGIAQRIHGPAPTPLAAGIHEMPWSEFVSSFATNRQRTQLADALHGALIDLRDAGVRDAAIGGSFVTGKTRPGDVDLVFWAGESLDARRVRSIQDSLASATPKIDAWGASESVRRPGSFMQMPALQFFQRNRDGARAGLAKLSLAEIPAHYQPTPHVG